ncbi:MAG: DNA-3-methyladenine glycosylase 2 family protein [Candidatus Bathyarchaeota archaeon]|nr:DNA-3-methyladenine glycosylase 2 family protein [Candidatus Bathyarchaeum sp.]
MFSPEYFYIYPKHPFDFELNCSVFGFNKPMPEVFEDGVWRRAIRLEGGKLIPVTLWSIGTIDEPKIQVKTFQTATKQEKEELQKKLDEIFSFSQDLTSFYAFMDKDPVLKELKLKFYGLKAGSIGTTVFESIIKSIIQQQISIRVAFSITNKMVSKFSEKIETEGTIYYDFPTPKQLSESTLQEIRHCGVSWKKAEYIKGIADKTAEGEFDPESLRSRSNEEVVETLKKFRGVGTWTAEMVLATGLKRGATVPAGDLGVRRTFTKLYSENKILSEAEVRKIAEQWGEFTKDLVFYITCIERV